ncbi:MAG TPA: hypothetical protein VL379_17925 [Pseudomonadales bacterium]|nr:hypothetical protein [Pseudomonadales bacterium]
MGKLHDSLTPPLIAFIEAQKMFFVGTAPLAGSGHVNVSPKGMDSLRVLVEAHQPEFVELKPRFPELPGVRSIIRFERGIDGLRGLEQPSL